MAIRGIYIYTYIYICTQTQIKRLVAAHPDSMPGSKSRQRFIICVYLYVYNSNNIPKHGVFNTLNPEPLTLQCYDTLDPEPAPHQKQESTEA